MGLGFRDYTVMGSGFRGYTVMCLGFSCGPIDVPFSRNYM